MAMVRTVFSPRCWATSSTRRLPWFVVSSALRIAGSSPSNCTSTTAPVTWRMRPTLDCHFRLQTDAFQPTDSVTGMFPRVAFEYGQIS